MLQKNSLGTEKWIRAPSFSNVCHVYLSVSMWVKKNLDVTSLFKRLVLWKNNITSLKRRGSHFQDVETKGHRTRRCVFPTGCLHDWGSHFENRYFINIWLNICLGCLVWYYREVSKGVKLKYTCLLFTWNCQNTDHCLINHGWVCLKNVPT